MPIPTIWPFQRKPPTCPAPVKRQLSFSPSAVPSVVLPVGANGFQVHWESTTAGNSSTAGTLSVTHTDEPHRLLWSTIPGECFFGAAAGEECIRDKRGSLNVDDRIVYACTRQTVERVYVSGRGGHASVVIEGTLLSGPQCEGVSKRKGPSGSSSRSPTPPPPACTGNCVIKVPYRLVFTEKQAHHLGFEVIIGAPTTGPLRSQPLTVPSLVEGYVGNPEPDLGGCGKEDYVKDWLAGVEASTEEDQRNSLAAKPLASLQSKIQPPSSNEKPFLSTWNEQEADLDGSDSGFGLTSSTHSSDEFASSQSQWSDSGGSEVLSAHWWSLAASATGGQNGGQREGGAQTREKGCSSGKKRLLPINRVQLTYASDPEERFFGFGEQFSHFDLKGKRIPIVVQEQGIGRGDQPITFLANLASPGSGGSDTSSYAAVPHYITSRMRSLYLESYEYAVFDLRAPNAVHVRVHSSGVRGRILHGTTPAQLIERYTAAIGRMRPLPRWLTRGAVVGLQGGTARVRGILSQLRAHKVPLAGVWLQDWVGQRRTAIGWQLWWNWQLDRKHYPEWEQLLGEIREQGAHVMGYVNPFLAKVGGSQAAHYGRDLFHEASSRGFLVQARSGAPYMVENTSFSAGLVDLTNADAREWLKDVIKTEMVRLGINGWMADFGESLPFDSRLHSGEDPAIVHNKYPEMWAQLNREVVEEVEAERAMERHVSDRTTGRALVIETRPLVSETLQQTPLDQTSRRTSLSSLSSPASFSSSWATLPSDDSGDHPAESSRVWSPDPFAVPSPDSPEDTEPFVLDGLSVNVSVKTESDAPFGARVAAALRALPTEGVGEDLREKAQPNFVDFAPENRLGRAETGDPRNGFASCVKGGVLSNTTERGGQTPVKKTPLIFSELEPKSSLNRAELVARGNGFATSDADEFVDATEGKNAREEDDARPVFFMRAGYRGSPGAAALFWLGDQMTSWQRHDGIKSAVTGLLSGGMSGFSLNHGDIGGYCSVSLPGWGVTRSEELLLRWMELSAFTLVFRTHEGNLPDKGAQAYSNARTLAHFGRLARVYVAWDFYRQQLMQEAASTGLPVVRHLFLHYPHDPTVLQLIYEQFLVGDQILVAPVLDPGTAQVKVYLPPGETWQHVWSGKLYRSELVGSFVEVEAPIGFPAVFVREGSEVGRQFCQNLRDDGLLPDP